MSYTYDVYSSFMKEEVLSLLTEVHLPVEDLDLEKLSNFIILKHDDRIIGTVGFEKYGSLALLRSLAISQGYQKQNLGRTLVQELEALAKKKNITSLYLLTQTAEMFFFKLGFQRIEREEVPDNIKNTEEFKSICPSSALCMKKNIQ